MDIALFDYVTCKPFAYFGLTGPFWTVHLDTLLYTWAVFLVIGVLTVIGRRALRHDKSVLYCAYEQVLQAFIDLCKDTLKSSEYRYVHFLVTLFLFTCISCIIGVVPFLDEPTKDLNTTLALALASFFYVTYQKIKVHGLGGYLREFIEPTIFLAPIHLVGECSKIASMSFRLFGNILGGSVILSILIGAVGSYKEYYLSFVFLGGVIHFLIKISALSHDYKIIHLCDKIVIRIIYAITAVQLIFGVLEGIVQAFVLTMLTATYVSMGIASEDNEQPCLNDSLPIDQKDEKL